jgi:hypothetical protein
MARLVTGIIEIPCKEAIKFGDEALRTAERVYESWNILRNIEGVLVRVGLGDVRNPLVVDEGSNP